MPSAAQPDYWSGNVYIQEVNSLGQALGDKIGCLEANLFTYQPGAEQESITSKKHNTYGAAVATVTKPTDAVIGINFWDSPDLIKAASIFGTVESVSYLAASATAQPSVAVLDGWVNVQGDRKNIDPLSFVLTSDPAGTTYQIDVDYEFNPRLGMWRAIPGGAITAAAAVLETWTSAAYDTVKISSGTKSQFRIRVEFDGKNLVTDDYTKIIAPVLTIAPGQALDFLGDTHTEYQFTGTAAASVTEPPLTIERVV